MVDHQGCEPHLRVVNLGTRQLFRRRSHDGNITLMSENSISASLGPSVTMSQHTFTADFGLTSLQVSKERAVMRVDLHDKLRNDAGAAALGMLTTVVDIVTSTPALAACSPDWTATQDLSIHTAEPLTEGPVVVDTHLVRIGKKTVHVAAEIFDGCGITDMGELVTALDDGALRPAGRGPSPSRDSPAPQRPARTTTTPASGWAPSASIPASTSKDRSTPAWGCAPSTHRPAYSSSTSLRSWPT